MSAKKIPFPEYVFFQEGPGLRNWQWTPTGMKVINVTNIIGDGSVDVSNTDKYISDHEYDTRYRHFAIDADDILIASSGNTYGKVGRIRAHHLPVMMNTSVIRFRSNNTDKLDNEYLYAYLRSSLFRNQVEQFVTGGAQPNFGPTHVKQMFLHYVPIETQRKIGGIVRGYDDLIDNNRKRIALLEKAARLLYEEWFVRLRFPGHEHTPVVDGVPEGWEKVLLPDAIEINPRTKVAADGEKWFAEMACLNSSSMVVSSPIKKEGNSGSKFKNHDTLLARITPCLQNGKTGYVDFLKGEETGFGSTEFIVLRGKKVPSQFVYCFARTEHFRGIAMKSMVGSSGRQRVQTVALEDYELLLPRKALLQAFETTVSPAFEAVRVLSTQNQKLQQARDLLLPRLMSGELAV